TVDYYTTAIEDEIGALPAGLILSNCYSQEEPSNCGQILRDPDNHLIERILAANANIGETETSGVDFGLDYAAGTPLGILSAQLESNMLVRYDQTLPSAGGPELVRGKGYYDLGVFPTWRHAASVGLAKGRFSAGLTWRYVGGFEECEDDDCKGKYRRDVETEPRSRQVESNSTFNLRGSCELATAFGRSLVTVGVNNLFDRPPAVIFNGFLGTSDASTYDFMGRYLYLRLTQFR
ncbi:MAG: TonB-dependent receptor, partial [Gemmatimonadetes bacterium]|nr:TonB-dependent receptor [Gemmatimonadota bacterium]